MRTHVVVSVLALSTTLVACKKKEEPASTKAAAKPSEPAPAPAPASGPFGEWDLAARKAAFQGAHVVPGGSLGRWEAWNVQGDKVTLWNGTEEKTLDLAVISPCEVKIIEKGADGSTSSTTAHYTVDDGTLITGLGDAGAWAFDTAIACVSNAVFTLDEEGRCTEWHASMFDDGKYEAKPGTCGWKPVGSDRVFSVTLDGHTSELKVDGDALLSEQLMSTRSEKVADFAAAKAARDAKK